MNINSIKVPQTDEEVKQILYSSFSNQNGFVSAYNLYCIYREQDKMTVIQSFEKTLQTIVNIYKTYDNEHK